MIKKALLSIFFIIFHVSCSHTLVAPLKPLHKSEFKHSFYTPAGYQYQKAVSDTLEIGVDISITNLGGNLRYHLSKSEKSLNSIQVGLDITGAIINYMYTNKINNNTLLRIGPHLSYQYEFSKYSGSEKLYNTVRLGASFSYSIENWWMIFGYSHPIYKDYPNLKFNPFFSSAKNLLYGNIIYSIEYRLGYSF